MKALDRKLLRDLWRLKTQVLTIAIVVASGVAAFVGSSSAHTSIVRLRDSYYETGRFAHVFSSVKRAPLRIENELRSLAGVADAEATVVGNVLVSLPDVSESMTGVVIALPLHGEANINRIVLRSGQPLEPDDSKGVLVSDAFAKHQSLKPGSRVTLLINGTFESFVVRGTALSPQFIYAAAAGGLSDETRFGVFWLNRERLDAAFDMKGAFNSISLRVTQGASIPYLIAATDRLLAPFGSSGAYGREDQVSNRMLSQEIEQQRIFAVIFPIVFMAVALFLLNVLLARHIATERSQIATLKALGYGNVTVASHYLKLVLLIAILGSALGIALGAWYGSWMTHLYTRFYQFPEQNYRMELWLPTLATVITVIAAVLGSVRAILSVTQLPPAEAMHPPVPGTYRATLMDRLHLGHLYSPESRMIVREIERRPVRAALTSFGIAGSICVLVGGIWWGAAFDYLMNIEFAIRDRADVVLALAEPTELAALYEIERLPGVLSVEGFRDVPVEIRNGQHRLRVDLMGAEQDAKLRRALDAELQPLPVVRGGLALTQMAADRLRVRPGDLLWVDPLEGAESARWMPVTTIVGDLTGLVAYTTRRDAAALAGDEDTISTVRVRLDSQFRERFFARVRQIPRIAAVGDKLRTIRHFRENTARNLLMFTGILSVFAAAISVGVVYNSARIQLAEHSWELATLRVLGFTRAEVSRMLLGQLAVQMLVAAPLGCVLGFGFAAVVGWAVQSDEMRFPLVVLPSTYAYAVLIMLAAGIVSALVVRRRIDGLDLVGVLKTRE